MRTSTPREAPADVYYVVESQHSGPGERRHVVASPLYATMSLAQAELARLVSENDEKAYAVWKASTYIEPARWARDVVLDDGTVLRGELLTAVKES
jgi:hypothetical protein